MAKTGASEALRRAVFRSASKYHAALIAERPQESWYGLSLVTDNDGQYLALSAASVESMKRNSGGPDRAATEGERNLWDLASWADIDGGRNEAQKVLGAIWAQTPERSFDAVHSRVFKAMFLGLKDFARPDVLASNGQRGRLIVQIHIGDPDANMYPQLIEWAKKLNPDAADLWFHQVKPEEVGSDSGCAAFSICDRDGVWVESPTEKQIRDVLTQLDRRGPGLLTVWLRHEESGWVLEAFEDGRLLWFNNNEPKDARHMKGVPRERMVELFLRLARGEIEAISKLPWLPGTGRA